MPTIKRTAPPTAYEAALLAADSPLLARVHEIAAQHFKDHDGETLRQSLQTMIQLRDRNAAALAGTGLKFNISAMERALICANSSIERLTRRISDLRCASYRFARARLFAQTGQHFCSDNWPDEPATETSPAGDNTPSPQAELSLEGHEPQTRTHAAHAARAETPSNKQVKAAVRRLAQGGLSGARCEEFRSMAKAGAWTQDQMETRVQDLLANASGPPAQSQPRV